MEKMFILKIIALIIASIVIYFFIKKIKSPKNSQNKTDKKQQNKINTQFVKKIIRNSFELSLVKRLEYIKAFSKWQITQGELFKNASKAQIKVFFEFVKKHKPYGFKGVYSNEKPSSDYELVMADCFTEPFPSSHDGDDWNRDVLIFMLMIFEVIEPFKSEDYYFHEKKRFVNHKMVQAIIMVDLYKKSN